VALDQMDFARPLISILGTEVEPRDWKPEKLKLERHSSICRLTSATLELAARYPKAVRILAQKSEEFVTKAENHYSMYIVLNLPFLPIM
jgi:hypothetical protein